MNDQFTPHAFVGFASPNLVGERPVAGRFQAQRRAKWAAASASEDLYANGFAAGVRETKDRLHGNALFALAVGTVVGTATGVLYRELATALAAALGY